MVVIGNEAPASAEQGLHFYALLFAALGTAGAIGIKQAAVIDPEIGICD